MSERNEELPQVLYEALLAKTKHRKKREILETIHNLCDAESNKESPLLDRANIGRFLAITGVVKSGRMLYNDQSKDYCDLIDAWKRTTPARKPHAGSSQPTGSGDFPAWLLEIPDPVIRQLVQREMATRRNAVRELDLLKGAHLLKVDLRTTAQSTQPPNAVSATQASRLELGEQELRAIAAAASADLMAAEGWQVGQGDSVTTHTGRQLYKPGYLAALRKILIHFKHTPA